MDHASTPDDMSVPEHDTASPTICFGRVVPRTNADNTFATCGYADASDGQTVTITDENGHQTVQTWAASGSPSPDRLMSVRDADYQVTSYDYNALGSLRHVYSPGISAREWTYNAKNQSAVGLAT